MSGITNATGDADGPPTKAGAAVCDFLAGIHLCAGILGALVQRERTGKGQRVEIAMHEAAVIALASAMGAVMDGDVGVPDRTGNRHPALAMAPYNTYRCADGYVAIFTAAERHWHSMCKMLGRPELLDDPGLSSTIGRAKRMAEVDDIVGAWTLARTKDQVLRELNEAHVPCAPVSPIRLHTGGKSEVRRPAPTLGQDTEAVLGELLGLKADELATLRAQHVTEPVTERKKA